LVIGSSFAEHALVTSQLVGAIVGVLLPLLGLIDAVCNLTEGSTDTNFVLIDELSLLFGELLASREVVIVEGLQLDGFIGENNNGDRRGIIGGQLVSDVNVAARSALNRRKYIPGESTIFPQSNSVVDGSINEGAWGLRFVSPDDKEKFLARSNRNFPDAHITNGRRGGERIAHV
jgi:hypothetical protein